MWFNVWFIIWPNQKKALGIVTRQPGREGQGGPDGRHDLALQHHAVDPDALLHGGAAERGSVVPLWQVWWLWGAGLACAVTGLLLIAEEARAAGRRCWATCSTYCGLRFTGSGPGRCGRLRATSDVRSGPIWPAPRCFSVWWPRRCSTEALLFAAVGLEDRLALGAGLLSPTPAPSARRSWQRRLQLGARARAPSCRSWRGSRRLPSRAPSTSPSRAARRRRRP